MRKHRAGKGGRPNDRTGIPRHRARLLTAGDKTPRREGAEDEEHLGEMEGYEILQEEGPALDHRSAQPRE